MCLKCIQRTCKMRRNKENNNYLEYLSKQLDTCRECYTDVIFWSSKRVLNKNKYFWEICKLSNICGQIWWDRNIVIHVIVCVSWEWWICFVYGWARGLNTANSFPTIHGKWQVQPYNQRTINFLCYKIILNDHLIHFHMTYVSKAINTSIWQ